MRARKCRIHNYEYKKPPTPHERYYKIRAPEKGKYNNNYK